MRSRWLRWRFPSGGGWSVPEGAQNIVAVGVAVFGVLTVGAAGRAALHENDPTLAIATVVSVGGHVPSSDNWTERLSDPSAWTRGDYTGGRPVSRSYRYEEPSRRLDDEDEKLPSLGRERGTYRTVCVRLCDGYFFPISFATTPDRFGRDAASCQSSCRSSARLYVYPNPGGEPEEMVSLEGRPYGELKTAFLFRTNYDAACTCKPQPWEKEALDRHRAYAEAAASRTKSARGSSDDRTRTVARTIRTDVPAATTSPTEAAKSAADAPPTLSSPTPHAKRPDGAMLLGADEPSKRERETSRKRNKAPAQASRSEPSRSATPRGDWRQRAFSGN